MAAVDPTVDELRYAQSRAQIVVLIVTMLALFGTFVIVRGVESVFEWVAAAVVVVLAAGMPILLWRPNAVVLTPAELRIETAFRTSRYDWDEVSDLRIWEHKYLGLTLNRFVTFDLADWSRTARALASAMSSGHASLPQVDIEVDELLGLALRYHASARGN